MTASPVADAVPRVQSRLVRIGLVIPAYNEAQRLPNFLLPLCVALAGHHAFAVDLIVVDDGSRRDHSHSMKVTCDAARSQLGPGTPHTLRYELQPHHSGKGGAVRAGWKSARRDNAWLGFVDSDGSAVPTEVLRLLGLCRNNTTYGAVIGCRYGRQMTQGRRSLRAIQGRFFALLVRAVTRLNVDDSQCGIKFIRADALRPLLPALTCTGWLLDVEVLHDLQAKGIRIRQEPLAWEDKAGSKLVFALDAWRMLWGLWALRRNFATKEATHTPQAS